MLNFFSNFFISSILLSFGFAIGTIVNYLLYVAALAAAAAT